MREEVFGPALERLQKGLVVVADREDGQLRVLDRQLADHLQGSVLVGVEGNNGQVGHRLLLIDHVEEVFVAGALGFEPDEIDAEQ